MFYKRISYPENYINTGEPSPCVLNLPTIAGGVPFLLEIEPTTDVEFLRGLGFEVVCDLDEGFIVVSSEQTDLEDFLQKVDGFVSNM